MKRILVLGKNGFICKSIIPLLENEGHDLTCLSHTELDFRDLNKLREFFRKNEDFDFVIHGMLSGEGRLLKEDSTDCLYDNLLILENLLYLSPFYKKLVYFGSGAKENRNKDVIGISEGEFGEPPSSVYSLMKYLSGKLVLNNPKVICINIFNVFGPLEKDNRFIKSCITKSINGDTIEIWGNAYFDFFYIEDLFILINHYINNPPTGYEEINAVYDKKETLFWVADDIKHMFRKTCTRLNPEGINKNYTGNGNKLKQLNLPLMGLHKGIRLTYKKIKEELNLEKEWENGGSNN